MIRVLLVDDHEVVRHGLADILTTQLGDGVVVHQAEGAGEAINLLISQEWHLVVLDINLPGRSGFEVLEEARRLCPGTPVLVLTAYAEEEFAVRAFKLGAAGYVNKQAVSEELIVAVRRTLAGGKYVTAALAERLASSLGSKGGEAPHDALSQRELEVLRLVAVGKSTKDIASDLNLSEKTVATYRTRIGEKTGLKSNVEIARYALKHKLVE